MDPTVDSDAPSNLVDLLGDVDVPSIDDYLGRAGRLREGGLFGGRSCADDVSTVVLRTGDV